VTAANASKLNDGGCGMIIMSEEAVRKYNIKPLARIVNYADAEVDPMDFNVSFLGK
jgi:acetyl-CoA C-acetyltransferase